MNPQTLSSALAALRRTGSVFGVLFTKGRVVLHQDTALPEDRLADLVANLDDIAYYFEQEKRRPDQISFGYDGGNLLLFLRGDLRLLLLHHQVDEVDDLAAAATAFLKDHAMSALVDQWVLESASP